MVAIYILNECKGIAISYEVLFFMYSYNKELMVCLLVCQTSDEQISFFCPMLIPLYPYLPIPIQNPIFVQKAIPL